MRLDFLKKAELARDPEDKEDESHFPEIRTPLASLLFEFVLKFIEAGGLQVEFGEEEARFIRDSFCCLDVL